MNTEFNELHVFLRQLVHSSDLTASRHPDFSRVESYWHLGRILVETEQQGQERADYGVQLIESLSDFLTIEFGKGYRRANLWWFRQFYLAFPILHALRGELIDLRSYLRTELTWTHYRQLIAIENTQKRHFYLHTAADEGWSTRTLSRLIKTRYYEQVALGEEMLVENTDRFLGINSSRSSRRSQTAQIRQQILGQPNWALIDIRGSGLPVNLSKPDLVFYRINQQRLVGIWVATFSAQLQETIRHQLEAWNLQKPGNSPVGILLEGKSKPRTIYGSSGIQPSASDLADLVTF
jgi:hypothetical protein